ncbi:MAG TPA: carboxypeptidase regulatory-like domain-containing protein [Myxococcaceae bacterium]|nr:carboxypeptidase regulatory-like domain-containing protein [Myxococcaceae bacterium]
MRKAILVAVLTIATLARAQYTEAAVASGGTISGRITYDGSPPNPEKVTITQDPGTCGTSRELDEWKISPTGGVKDVVVYLADIKSGKKMDLPAKPVLDQKGCHYDPHTQIIAQNADLQVKNSDPILHNIHSYQEGRTILNIAEPKQGMVVEKKMKKSGGETLKCDVHNFMRGSLFVAENPYAVVTDADGKYELKEVPAGTYQIGTFHEVAGTKMGSVTVPAGGKVTFDAKIKK